MTDEVDNQDEDEARPTHRYWFPKNVIRFLIPLPDPLPTHDGHVYIRTTPLQPWDISPLEANGAVEVGSGWLRDLRANIGLLHNITTDPDESARDERDGTETFYGRIAEDRPHAGLHAFLYTLRLWAGSAAGTPFPELKYVGDVSRRISALNNGTGEVDPDEIRPHLVQDIDYTVAEVVLPFNIEIDRLESPETQKLISESFDEAIRAIQLFQNHLYAVRRYPQRQVTKELCPPILPFFVGKVDPDYGVGGHPVNAWVTQSILLRENPWDFGRPSWLDDAELETLDDVIWTSLRGRPFSSYMELRRESTVALNRTGDYRASIIWSAAAAEGVFDELLKHLMWEQGQKPERCLTEFQTQSVAQRVRTYFQPKLGGSWDLDTPGPLFDWKRQVADVRNRVIHDHYRPTFKEAEDAILVVDRLITHLADQLVGRLKYYFRTAMQLAGNEGLERRGVFEKFKEYADASFELNWHATYARWLNVHQLLLGPERFGDLSRSELYFVYGRRNRGYWLAVDSQNDLAARVLVDEGTISPQARELIVSRLDGPQETNAERAHSIRIDQRPTIVKMIDKWREQYHLLPLYGVNVNGKDIADKEFIWRPSATSTP